MSVPSRPRIVFLNRCFWPDSEATGQLLADLCEDLSDSFDVHVVCGQPNSPPAGARYTKIGHQVRNGVTIHRLPHTRCPKRLPAGRLLNIVSFAHATSRYLRRTQLRADVFVSETDPFLLPIVASRHAARCRAKLVCYLQDIYPDVAVAIAKARSSWLTRRIRQHLRAVYQQADQIVVLGYCMRRRLQAAPWGISHQRFSMIPNWADCDLIQPRAKQGLSFLKTHGLEDRFVVMHSGNMGLTQRLDLLISAAQNPLWPQRAVLALVGDGAARHELERQAGLLRGDRIRFLPYQPQSELSNSLSAADLHVVSMHDNVAGCLCPSKLYGILAAGRPVLAICPEAADLHAVVKSQRLGWCCPPGNATAIASAVADAATEPAKRLAMGRRARRLAVICYDRKVVTTQFANLLREVTSTYRFDAVNVPAGV